MRKIVKKFAEWIHATLILALIMPIIYSLIADHPDMIGQTLYFKCLVIMLPIVATDYAINRCKGLFTYLVVCAMIFAATVAIGWIMAGSLHQGSMLWGYMVVLLGETAFVIMNRMAERLRQRKDDDAARGEDPTWRPYINSLRIPSFFVLIFFLAVYALALNLNNPAACNASLFSTALYTVITVMYQYVCETENYLSLNKRTCNIPSKRIYGIGSCMLAISLLLLILVLLPALFTISDRHYRDIRKSSIRIGLEYVELVQEEETDFAAENPMQTLIDQYGEPKPTPEWLIILSNVLEAAVFIFFTVLLIWALVKTILDTFRTFRESVDENGDIVEELEAGVDEPVKIKKAPVKRRKLSERERIRKEYRRFIRQYRKERPARHESPTEIEKNAGIAESAECKELHKHYELARYGREV